MIQTDLDDPFTITTIGDLRLWLSLQRDLADDTVIQVVGERNGDADPVIVMAKREWRPNENGCMVIFHEDGRREQVDQTVVVIREWAPDMSPDFDDDEDDEDADPKTIHFPVRS